jgi:type II secretory pathway pseudopilin PulG
MLNRFGHSCRLKLHDEAGLSYAELVVVLSILGVVIALSYLVFLSATNISDSTQASSQAREAAMRTLDKLTLELRQARPTTTGSTVVFASSAATSCEFFINLTPDSTTTLYEVNYYIQGTGLYRRVATGSLSGSTYTFGSYGSPQLMLDRISPTQKVFRYYAQGSTVETSNAAAISWVGVEIANSAKVGRQSASVDLSSTVKIRSVYNALD